MIKIVKAEFVVDYAIDLYFSNGKKGRCDFMEFVSRPGELAKPLKDVDYFKKFFLELGAICWKNGLELSASSLYKKLDQAHALKDVERAA